MSVLVGAEAIVLLAGLNLQCCLLMLYTLCLPCRLIMAAASDLPSCHLCFSGQQLTTPPLLLCFAPSCRLIMAASDLAAIFASVGISFWTQRSFKEPLIFSAASCLLGECKLQDGQVEGARRGRRSGRRVVSWWTHQISAACSFRSNEA